MEQATLGAGCFWSVEMVFRQTPGIIDTTVGYSGGTTKNPTYREVCSKRTGHAEVVQLTFDPDVIGYSQLLDIFWNNHNPTTPDRQGPDIGPQYRSVIFYHSETQKKEAEASMTRKQAQLTRPIVTQLVPVCPFYRAEEYHQQYLEKRGLTHCHL